MMANGSVRDVDHAFDVKNVDGRDRNRVSGSSRDARAEAHATVRLASGVSSGPM